MVDILRLFFFNVLMLVKNLLSFVMHGLLLFLSKSYLKNRVIVTSLFHIGNIITMSKFTKFQFYLKMLFNQLSLLPWIFISSHHKINSESCHLNVPR